LATFRSPPLTEGAPGCNPHGLPPVNGVGPAILHSPPLTDANVAVARFIAPPLTEAPSPTDTDPTGGVPGPATLNSPPLTDTKLPLARFILPPLTEDSEPSATLLRPPLTELAVPTEGQFGVAPGPAMLH